ncbi:hypothetical protein [Sorangium sp. So ce1078]|uniref:hypothetical protein n=1 Tax=Sorangium sp. So ce1078 TaxID=3133329 RepID=UPI003F640BEB
MFTLGVYAVETSLPGLAPSSRDALPANATDDGPASVLAAASRQAAAPEQLPAAPPASTTEAAAQAPPPPSHAETPAPPAQPSAEAAPTPPAQPSAEAAPAPPQQPVVEAGASAPPIPRRGYGFLKLNSSQNATVYVTGVAVGPSNQPIEVRCGRFFVRIGEPTRDGTRWLTEGRSVRIKCGALTEASF